MKIAKILSAAAASAVATAAIAATASADFKPYESTNSYVSSEGAGNYGIMVTSTGEADAPVSTLAADFGFAPEDIGGAYFVVTIPETDSTGADGNRTWWDGSIGGGIVTSLHTDTDKTTYNWPSQGEFWGVIDEDLGLDTLAAEKAYHFEKVGDYTYKLTAMFNFDEALSTIEGDHIVQYRIFMQGWDHGMAEYQVTECGLLDDAGAPLVQLTGDGYPLTDAPAPDAPAPDATDATDATSTPSTDKGSADTGVEGVAAVAGVAVIAAGAVVLSKKRK